MVNFSSQLPFVCQCLKHCIIQPGRADSLQSEARFGLIMHFVHNAERAASDWTNDFILISLSRAENHIARSEIQVAFFLKYAKRKDLSIS